MFLKYLQNLLTVSLKYFFNFELHLFTPAILVIIVSGGVIKLFFSRMREELAYGLETVKDDVINFAQRAKEYREQWENSDTHEQITNYTRSIKQHLSRQ